MVKHDIGPHIAYKNNDPEQDQWVEYLQQIENRKLLCLADSSKMVKIVWYFYANEHHQFKWCVQNSINCIRSGGVVAKAKRKIMN